MLLWISGISNEEQAQQSNKRLYLGMRVNSSHINQNEGPAVPRCGISARILMVVNPQGLQQSPNQRQDL